jgi:hypothetical protein
MAPRAAPDLGRGIGRPSLALPTSFNTGADMVEIEAASCRSVRDGLCERGLALGDRRAEASRVNSGFWDRLTHVSNEA